jgi:hypothetical protein
MTVNRILGVLLLVGSLAACAGSPEVKSQFSPEQASFVNAKGDYTIAGQAFMRRRDGQVVYAAGSPVALIPRTQYADEVMNIVFAGGTYRPSPPRIENLDSRYMGMRREVVANGEGRFKFSAVSAGEYYVTVPVTWEAGTAPQGGLLLRRVSLPRDDNSELVITY